MSEQGSGPSPPTELGAGQFAGSLHLGSKNHTPAYWYVPRNQLVFVTDPTSREPVTVEQHRLSQETVGGYIHQTERDGAVWSLTDLGLFLRNVASFGDVRILTVRQEEAYALCRIAEVERHRAAELLGISVGVLDDHLSTAQKKITCAFNLIEAVNS